jgi:hypothetical protein
MFSITAVLLCLPVNVLVHLFGPDITKAKMAGILCYGLHWNPSFRETATGELLSMLLYAMLQI